MSRGTRSSLRGQRDASTTAQHYGGSVAGLCAGQSAAAGLCCAKKRRKRGWPAPVKGVRCREGGRVEGQRRRAGQESLSRSPKRLGWHGAPLVSVARCKAVIYSSCSSSSRTPRLRKHARDARMRTLRPSSHASARRARTSGPKGRPLQALVITISRPGRDRSPAPPRTWCRAKEASLKRVIGQLRQAPNVSLPTPLKVLIGCSRPARRKAGPGTAATLLLLAAPCCRPAVNRSPLCPHAPRAT